MNMKYFLVVILIFVLLFSKLKKRKKIGYISIILLVSTFFPNSYYVSLDSKSYLERKVLTAEEKKETLEYLGKWASNDMIESGIYASVTIGQLIQESGAFSSKGISELSYKYNNYFGMKAKGSCTTSGAMQKVSNGNGAWPGNAICACGRDGCYWYRAYDSMEQSLRDHSRNFWCTSTYGTHGVLNAVIDDLGPIKQLQLIKNSGYASDSNYVNAISKIISQYNLTKYDTGKFSGEKPSYATTCKSSSFNGNYELNGPSNNSSSNNFNFDFNPTTSYTGDLKNGYLYQRLINEKELGSTITDQQILDDLTKNVDNIISTIYQRVIKGLEYHGISNNFVNGISSSIGGIDAGEASSWRQCDKTWGSIHLGNSKATICSAGCLATSVAIQIQRSGASLSNNFNGNLNPGSFVQFTSKNGGYTSSGAWLWNTASKVAPSFQFVGKEKVNSSNVLSRIANYLNQNYYVVLHVYGSIKKNTTNHWMAVTGLSPNDIQVIDPAGRGSSIASAYGLKYVDQIGIYKVSG